MKFEISDHKKFFDDLAENDFHLFSRKNAAIRGFYPNEFPVFPALDILEIRSGDRITIRAFFATIGKSGLHFESGYVDLEVEDIDQVAKTLFGNILTKIPAGLALSKGTSIELDLDEVLFIQNR